MTSSYCLFSIKFEFFLFLSFKLINCFYIIPFDTIYIKDEAINETNNYLNDIMQNELYMNLSMGIPQQDLRVVLKMEKTGFMIYEDALKYNLSESYEEVDEKIDQGWIMDTIYFLSKDHFYLCSISSYKDIDKIKENCDMKKTNKAKFLRLQNKPGKTNSYNKMFYTYGIIGLKYNNIPSFNAPQFVLSFNDSNEIKSKCFSFKFENNLRKGFIDNNNKGYFIFGEELTDDIDEKNEINYIQIKSIGSGLAWALKFDKIYTKVNDIGIKDEEINKNFIEFKQENRDAGIIANNPYLRGIDEYFKYINETFFNDLVEKKVCHYNNLINNGEYYSYICDSKSEYFMERLNKSFPDLVFEHKDLEKNFTLTKNDLFAYNSFNDSDTNLYFLVINYVKKPPYYITWSLGIPFLKKYRLSFNYDSKMIGFYKNDGKIIDKSKKEDDFNFFESNIFKIFIIIILVIIIFILGMLFQKNLQRTRKKKANELDDNYEYESYKDNDNLDNKDNKGNKIGIEPNIN